MKIMASKLVVFLLIASALPHLVLAQGDNSAKNQSNKMNITSFNKYLPNATVESGYYTLEINEDSYCIKMMDQPTRNKQHYMIENCFDKDEVIELNNESSSVKRISGTLEFQKSTSIAGEFTFNKNANFVIFLRNEGIKLDNDLYYFKLFLGDIDEEYVLDIKKLGFEPTITELGRLVWHDASVAYIEEISKMFPNFNLDEISTLSAHDISTEYLNEFKALGIVEMDVHSIKKSKMKGITPQIIAEQKSQGNDFSDLKSYIRLLKKK